MSREPRYWLLKSEPSCFSFSDLQNRPAMTEQWDGVRNYQARNYLRDELKAGDLAFFYHSNIPKPEIAGVVRIASDGYPDWTAMDPDSRHFDPKSGRENPIWYMVDVRYLRPLTRPVSLDEMRGNPALAGMALLNRSRLSVQPVTAEQWAEILCMSGMTPDDIK